MSKKLKGRYFNIFFGLTEEVLIAFWLADLIIYLLNEKWAKLSIESRQDLYNITNFDEEI